MSPATVAKLISADPTVQAGIGQLLEQHRFSERECYAVLLLAESFYEGARACGADITPDMALRGGAAAVDQVWSRRGQAVA